MGVWILVGAAIATEPAIDVRVDDTVLAVTSAYFLADSGREYARAGDLEYATALRTALGPLAESPAVLSLRRLKAGGFDLDAPIEWALRLDPATLEPREPLPDALVARAGGNASLSALAADLRRFEADPAWKSFLTAEGSRHRAEVDRFRTALNGMDPLHQVEAFYGDSPPSAAVWVVAPPIGPSAWSFRIGSTVYAVASSLPYPGSELADRMPYLAVRELGQPSAAALVDAHWDRLQLAEGLMRPIQAAMTEEDVPTWQAALREHLGRAATCRILRSGSGEDAGTRCVVEQVARGYRYVPALYDAFAEYEADRSKYPTLDSFAPRILEVLLAIQHDGVDEWWRANRWATGALSLRGAINRVTTVVVFPTGGPEAAAVAEYADRLAKRCGGLAMPDTEAVGYHALEKRYLILGTIASNALLQKYAATLPWAFDADGLTVSGRRVIGPAIRLLSMLPNPDGPSGDPWVVLTASTDALIPGMEPFSQSPVGWQASAPDGKVCATGALLTGVTAGAAVSCP